MKTMPSGWFRELDADEEETFRQWARDNYRVGSEISVLWHPIVASECHKMNEEA